jgi:hypothetical protein
MKIRTTVPKTIEIQELMEFFSWKGRTKFKAEVHNAFIGV